MASLERYIAREGRHAAAVERSEHVAPEVPQEVISDLVKIYGQSGAIPGCMLGRFSLEIAEENPQLRKRINASFDRWQHTIATIIERAIEEKELPADTDPESLAGFLLNTWEGALLRAQSEERRGARNVYALRIRGVVEGAFGTIFTE